MKKKPRRRPTEYLNSLLTEIQAAKKLGKSQPTLWEWRKKGKIQAVRTKSPVLYDPRDLDKLK